MRQLRGVAALLACSLLLPRRRALRGLGAVELAAALLWRAGEARRLRRDGGRVGARGSLLHGAG